MRARFVMLLSMALVACGAILGIEPGNPESSTSGVDAATEANGPTIPDPCNHVRPDKPPEVDDAPAVELPPFFLAMEGLVTTFKDREFGLDLDSSCTCDSRPGTAYDGGPSCIRKKPACDLEGGVDNSLGVIATQMSAFLDIAAGPNELVAAGERTLLVYIAQYNGRANDKDVTVALVVSRGIRSKGCPTSTVDKEGVFWTPGWCGDDPWSIEKKSVLDDDPLVPAVSGKGYIRDYRLVVPLSDAVVTLPFSGNFELALENAIVVGKLVPLGEDLKPRDPNRPPASEKENRLYRVEDGLIAGRITSKNFLTAIGTLSASKEKDDAGVRLQVCSQPTFQGIKDRICPAVDLARSQALDFDPAAKCTSLSTGLGFTATPALPGPVSTDTTTTTGPCHPNATGEPQGVAGVNYDCPPEP